MKRFRVCIQSYLWNNSDYKEYDNYYFNEINLEKAKEYAIKCIENWNKQSKDTIYYIFSLEQVN